ncbi:hypothetical protein DYB37_005697 [Aphanomyces astaci]|uniref:TauD/TfdA-like domain-containing protein n=1 Tax=Aphanomyces astaci TaxID=112090 RepID=A0A3R6ZH52_APHAT|nr:hypothetical protein DYB35_005015 [Aphanomyces astaci]RHZ25503.1 hypothetical protein DYB37_005697 [Aphanomyces astaci]
MNRVLFRRTKFTLAQHRHDDVLSFKFIQVLPVTGTLGAEVEGVDLTKPVPPPVVDEIHAAFLQYGVLFFRGQHGLTPHAHLAFARLFGSIGHQRDLARNGTQTTASCTPRLWARLGTASAAMTYEKGHDNSVVHPVVTIHPETGKRVLFVNPMFTQCFEHMTVRIVHESSPILSMLYGKAFRPEHQCRFRWSPGSVAFWDNRRLQHVAINDNVVSRRVMHRITIQGGVP